jgi:Tetratricopeptide repeat
MQTIGCLLFLFVASGSLPVAAAAEPATRAVAVNKGEPEAGPAAAIQTLVSQARRELDRGRAAEAEGYTAQAYSKAQAQKDLPEENLVPLLFLTRGILQRLYPDPIGDAAALPLLQRQLALEQRLDTGEESIGFTRSLLIGNLMRQERHEDTIIYLKQQAEASERLGDTRSRKYVNTISALTSLNMQRGDLAGALPYWQRLSALCFEVLGPRHPRTAATLEDVALLQQLLGQADAAAQTRRRRAELVTDPQAKPLVDDDGVVEILSRDLRPFLQHIEHAGSLQRNLDTFNKALEKSKRN